MHGKSSLYLNEPLWQSQNFIKAPLKTASWLNEIGSITQRLRAEFGLSVRVEVLSNSWQRSFLSESLLLGHDFKRYSLVREVLIFSQNAQLILARTIIPLATYQSQQSFIKLGARPLGEVIFSDPNLVRKCQQVTRVSPCLWRPELREDIALKTPLWGRRTVYVMHHQPLLVTEFFLPDLGMRTE